MPRLRRPTLVLPTEPTVVNPENSDLSPTFRLRYLNEQIHHVRGVFDGDEFDPHSLDTLPYEIFYSRPSGAIDLPEEVAPISDDFQRPSPDFRTYMAVRNHSYYDDVAPYLEGERVNPNPHLTSYSRENDMQTENTDEIELSPRWKLDNLLPDLQESYPNLHEVQINQLREMAGKDGYLGSFKAINGLPDHVMKIFAIFPDWLSSSDLLRRQGDFYCQLSDHRQSDAEQEAANSLMSYIHSLYWEYIGPHTDNMLSVIYDTYAYFLDPMPSIKEGMISYYTNKADLIRGKRSRVREGKFFRRILPTVDDNTITRIVADYRNRFTDPPLSLEIGDTREFFRTVYLAEAHKSNDIPHTDMKKSLANSCMSKFSTYQHHPTEAYASGDFELIAAWTDQGKLAARTIVCRVNKTHGPIYCVSHNSHDLVQAKLDEMGVEPFHEDVWKGAKLLKLPKKNYSDIFYLPYVDWHSWAADAGEHWEIGGRDRHVSLRNADGLARLERAAGRYFSYDEAETFRCEICDEGGIDIDEMFTSPDGECLCENCFNQHYTVSDRSGETISRDDVVEVRTAYRSLVRNRWIEETRCWSEDEANDYAVFIDRLGEWWADDCLTSIYDADGDFVEDYPTRYLEGRDDIAMDTFTGSWDTFTGSWILKEGAVRVINASGEINYTHKNVYIDDSSGHYVVSDHPSYIEEEDGVYVHIYNYMPELEQREAA